MFSKILHLIVIALILGCGSDKESYLSGMYDPDYIVWPDGNIPVCIKGFESVESETIQAALQDFVQSIKKMKFSFLTKEKCSQNTDHVLKIIKNEGFSGLHGSYNLISRTILLFTNYSESGLLNCGLPNTGMNCLWNIARHEFGHAVGMFHESKHRDSACKMPGVSNPYNTRTYGSYDSKSIMDHCYVYNNKLGLEKIELSKGDINMLRFLYKSD